MPLQEILKLLLLALEIGAAGLQSVDAGSNGIVGGFDSEIQVSLLPQSPKGMQKLGQVDLRPEGCFHALVQTPHPVLLDLMSGLQKLANGLDSGPVREAVSLVLFGETVAVDVNPGVD